MGDARSTVALSATTLLGRLNEQLWEIDSTLSSSHDKLARYFGELLTLFEVKEKVLRSNVDLGSRNTNAETSSL